MASREFRVLARAKNNSDVNTLYRLPDGVTRNEKNPNLKDTPGPAHLFNRAEVGKAMTWGLGHNTAVFATKSKYPFLVLDRDTAWGKRWLCNDLNELGKRRKRYLWVGEFKRTPHRQWELRMAYLNGTLGAVAAPCCTRYRGKHSWAACGKNSLSNHRNGSAADVSMLHQGRGGLYTNVALDNQCRAIMKSLELCCPVPNEHWHVEQGNRWAV